MRTLDQISGRTEGSNKVCMFTGKDATPEPYEIGQMEAREGYIKARGTDGRTEGGATDTEGGATDTEGGTTDSDAHSAPIQRTDVTSGRWRDCMGMESQKGASSEVTFNLMKLAETEHRSVT